MVEASAAVYMTTTCRASKTSSSTYCRRRVLQQQQHTPAMPRYHHPGDGALGGAGSPHPTGIYVNYGAGAPRVPPPHGMGPLPPGHAGHHHSPPSGQTPRGDELQSPPPTPSSCGGTPPGVVPPGPQLGGSMPILHHLHHHNHMRLTHRPCSGEYTLITGNDKKPSEC